MFVYVTVLLPDEKVGNRIVNTDLVVWIQAFDGTYTVRTEVDDFEVDDKSYLALRRWLTGEAK